MSVKKFKVVVTAKYPAYGETPGEFNVYASDRNGALRAARKHMSNAGWTKQDGPVLYSIKRDAGE